LQELLLRYREDLIAAKVAKEDLQDKLKREKRVFKDRVLAEQQQKEEVEEQLSNEIDALK
jgi:Rab GTPase-binding effector protein 1